MKINSVLKMTILLIVFFIPGLIDFKIIAQDVPVNLQAALFKKIFSFDKTLQAKGSFEVAVLGTGGDGVASAFKEAGINAKAIAGEQVPGGFAVVYVMPGITSTKSQTSSKGVLSISGESSFVENGKVAIAIGTEGGKPKIIVNMGQLKAEGQELSSELLKISKVIQ
jgi:hypothetical protein